MISTIRNIYHSKPVWMAIQIIAALMSVYLIQNPIRDLADEINKLFRNPIGISVFLYVALFFYLIVFILAYIKLIFFFIKLPNLPNKFNRFGAIIYMGTVHYQNQVFDNPNLMHNPNFVHLSPYVFWNIMLCSIPAFVGMNQVRIYFEENEKTNQKNISIPINKIT